MTYNDALRSLLGHEHGYFFIMADNIPLFKIPFWFDYDGYTVSGNEERV